MTSVSEEAEIKGSKGDEDSNKLIFIGQPISDTSFAYFISPRIDKSKVILYLTTFLKKDLEGRMKRKMN